MQISTENGGIPQKAIDGSTSAFFSNDTCTLTKQEKTPWWYVNLLEPYMVQLVRLDFGKHCCGKLVFKIMFFIPGSFPLLNIVKFYLLNRYTSIIRKCFAKYYNCRFTYIIKPLICLKNAIFKH